MNTTKKGFTAVHLCGSLAFQQLLSDTLPEDILLANRLQLNINARKQEFTNDEVLTVYEKALQLGPDIILQYHDGTAFLIEMFLDTLSADHKSRVHVLLDGSKGKGVAPTTWDAPKVLVHQYLGFAGGLGPHNITELMTLLNVRGLPYWPNMESGLRSENEFDLQKVVSVLVQANLLVQ